MNGLEKVEALVNRLSEGRPVGSLDTFGLIRQVGGDARREFRTKVEEYTTGGAANRTHATWLVADYGGGKSEMLLQLRNSLDQIIIGNNKVVVSDADLNKNLTNTYAGIQSSIFQTAAPLKLHNPDVQGLISQPGEQPDDRQALVLFGLDFLATITGVAVLGSSFWKQPIGWVTKKLALRERALADAVIKQGLTDESAVQLLVRWIRFAHNRDEASWQSFKNYREYLAEQERLFETQCRILRHFKYVTIVVLVDQAEKLVGETRLTQALVNLRDMGHEIGVNLFFVFAGTAEVRILSDEVTYGGFVRRFLDADQCSVVEAELDLPKIDGADNDLNRVRGPLANIAALHPNHYGRLKMTDKQFEAVRQKLVNSKEPVTWSVFWRALLVEQPNKA